MTIKDPLTERQARLSATKQMLLEKLSRGQAPARDTGRTIGKRAKMETARLSFAQERMWFLEQFQGGTATYNLPAMVRLKGELDITVLERSLAEVIKRHESLRTGFFEADGAVWQRIAPVVSLALEVETFPWGNASDREEQLRQEAAREVQKPFDLGQAPLLRARLLQLEETEYALLLTMHHSIADGWSMGILIREVAALYAAFAAGQPAPLPSLGIQYADFAEWQRDWLQGENLGIQLNYWKQRLGGSLPVLELPTDRCRPPVQRFHGACHSFRLEPQLAEKLNGLSRQCGVTLFMTLLGALQVLLHRYSGQTDIIIGSPIANRHHPQTEPLIGLFVNTLALRGDLSGDPSFRTLLGRVQETTLGAYGHQDLPFELLVKELRPERDPSRTPIFQVMLVLQNTPTQTLALPGLELTLAEPETGTAKFDLTMLATESEQGLQLVFEYNTDLFEAETIERMAGHFQHLVAGIVENPDAPIAKLPMVAAAERNHLLNRWSQPEIRHSADELVLHQLIEAQVKRTPQAVAVIEGQNRLTYQELNDQAEALASFLQQRGIGPEQRVGLLLEPCMDLVVAVLAVLKAGGAYAPMDPSYPPERLTALMTDAGFSLVLTHRAWAGLLESFTGEAVALDQFQEGPVIIEARRRPVVSPDSCAYVIYTSGSTGMPKGVMVEHRSAANYLHWCKEHYPHTKTEGALLHSSPAFDLTVTSLFLPLLQGASIRIVPPGPGVSTLADTLRQGPGWSQLKVTPTHLEALQHEITPAEMAGKIGNLIVGGEALRAESLAGWRAADRNLRIINEYGPTETTVGCTAFVVPADFPQQGSVPIGRPIANTWHVVLDAARQLVPMGVPGELYVGGAGVARGYLDRPDLTASRFVQLQLNGTETAEFPVRWYRTGDLVRAKANGELEYWGRIDQQVKIRGYRIELGEIETVLSRHPLVREAAVRVQPHPQGMKHLVGYVALPDQPAEGWAGELTAFLKTHLPEFMVPGFFVSLDRLPVNAHGKLDQGQLPQPDWHRTNRTATYFPPTTEAEIQLTGLWADVLGVERVGLQDNFFELGGHSLLATQVFSRIRQTFEVQLPLRELFEHPTPAGLLTVIERERNSARRPARPALQAVDRNVYRRNLASLRQEAANG